MSALPKLVRDRIPKIIIRDEQKTPITRVLNNDEFRVELLKKLQEEAREVLEAEPGMDRLSELADLLEVMKAVAELDSASLEDIEKIRAKKAEERGGYTKRILLESVN